MLLPFANKKRDAGAGTPVLPTTGGTAAGSVGAAVPLPGWSELLNGIFALARSAVFYPTL